MGKGGYLAGGLAAISHEVRLGCSRSFARLTCPVQVNGLLVPARVHHVPPPPPPERIFHFIISLSHKKGGD